MIFTYSTVTPDGGVVPVSKAVVCPFCGPLAIPIFWGADQVYRWLEFEHLKVHVEELANYQPEPVTCARCKRVPLEGGPPHRPCFQANPVCECPCSYPAPPVDLSPQFKEAE